MLNLTTEKSKENLKNHIILPSIREKPQKLFIKLSLNQKKKINLKKINISDKNLNQYYNSVNNSTSGNSEIDFSSGNKEKDNIVSSKSFKNKRILTENDKKKVKDIVTNFRKHKVVTERLLKKEKSLALNSVNNSNYAFLLTQSEDKNIRKKSKNIIYRNQYNDFSSYMIKKFNNKTFDILDPPNKNPIYSTNLEYFRPQLINNFNEYKGNLEYARKKYNDAMNVGEINDEKNIKKAIKMEHKFYQNKFNILKNKDFKDINGRLINKIKQMYGYCRNSYLLRNNSKTFTSPIKKEKTSIIKDKDFKDNLSNKNLKIFHDLKNTFPRKKNTDEINMHLYNNKIRFSLSHIKDFTNIKVKNEKAVQNIIEAHKLKEKKKIKQVSSDYSNSFYEINDYPYEKITNSYSRDKVGDINIHNLTRVKKINIINKYLYNLEDDDLLLHNPKKLKEELKKVQIACEKNNYRTNYNFSFLRKNLKKETINKFNCIKDSRFGFPS